LDFGLRIDKGTGRRRDLPGYVPEGPIGMPMADAFGKVPGRVCEGEGETLKNCGLRNCGLRIADFYFTMLPDVSIRQLMIWQNFNYSSIMENIRLAPCFSMVS